MNIFISRGKFPQFTVVVAGWGLSLSKSDSGEKKLDEWLDYLEAKIVFKKLKGFVENRAIAYSKSGTMNKDRDLYIKSLLIYFNRIDTKGADALYRMVVAHEEKFMALLPYKENMMNKYIPEIISFCKEKINLKK